LNRRTFATPHVIDDETTALRYVIYLLSCARSVRHGPLAEHLTRSVEAASAAPAETVRLLGDLRLGPSLEEQLAAYAEKYAGLVTGFTWSAPSGSEEHPAGTPQMASRFQRKVEMENLIANAHLLRGLHAPATSLRSRPPRLAHAVRRLRPDLRGRRDPDRVVSDEAGPRCRRTAAAQRRAAAAEPAGEEGAGRSVVRSRRHDRG
jgi:hypothetical protein